MSGFDLVFALFGLVLGLAITEVLSGFSRVLKMRGKAHVGWLVPMLGLVVLLDLTSFWSSAYELRDILPANLLTLFAVMSIISTYYLIATLIFPDDPDRWPDFDLYYDRYNRLILGGMLGVNFAMLLGSTAAYILLAKAEAPEEDIGLWEGIFELAPVALIIALLIVKGRRKNLALLILLALDFLAMAIAELL